ncbi:HAD-IA family hydrolase [Celeribacter ethanolicus]|uniref:HAD-IA family hydrolase n=1 Tax=Celeribacter ethanolicus TaxID=1758178 RepID=UPI00082E9858|nr:HAD-IA family hydrolase [Celeribacter ethanolicus]TNE63013.1 MAG: HAD family hydrolase [Paracoccaceae bacterium]
MRTVIFDLDGTLADTSADLIAAANACFRGLGYGDVLDPVADAHTAFRGGRAMLTLGFSRVKPGFGDAEVMEQYPVLLDVYAEHIDTHTRLYDGAAEAVEALRRDGYAVGVCTNKPEDLADRLLTRLGVRDLFGSMIGAKTVGVSKPDPKPYVAAVEEAGGVLAQSFLVGDTETDRATAKAAGVPSVLVTFGPDGDGVKRLEPEALLTHYNELSRLTKELIG